MHRVANAQNAKPPDARILTAGKHMNELQKLAERTSRDYAAWLLKNNHLVAIKLEWQRRCRHDF